MSKRIITESLMKSYEHQLYDDEKSKNTTEKYLRDILRLSEYAGKQNVDKALILRYKSELMERYSASSVNSMIAAINSFLRFAGWTDLCLKQFRVQKSVYCTEEKELTKAEYIRLVRTAQNNGNERLSLLLQTICGTGIRVSELKFITVDAVKKGEAVVRCKGKIRKVFIVKDLRKRLQWYINTQCIRNGPVFVTRQGHVMNRSNIWREMKSLCRAANVSAGKVFPHNLRHLFARTFYRLEKDIAKLADILGHSSIDTTRIYILTTGQEHRRKMEKMKLVVSVAEKNICYRNSRYEAAGS